MFLFIPPYFHNKFLDPAIQFSRKTKSRTEFLIVGCTRRKQVVCIRDSKRLKVVHFMERHGSSRVRRSGSDFEGKVDLKPKSDSRPLPPVSKRDVEQCMDELELKMEKSRKSLEEKKIKLEGVNPTKEDSPNLLIDYRKGNNDLYLGARFIFECGIKLELQPTTIATAAVLYHRFFCKTSVRTYDVCTIGATSVFLACKVENEKRRMRDIINVVQQSIERDAELLDMDEKYFAYKNGIVQSELFMMRILEFQVNYTHPHRYLVHYLRELQHWMGYENVCSNTIFRTAWSFLQDFHHNSSVINYKPQELAIAAIQLSLHCFGATVPGDKAKAGKKSWKTVFFSDFDEDMHQEIMTKMIESYDKEMEFIPELLYSKESASSEKPIKTESFNEGPAPTPVPPPPQITNKMR
ncbi:unnamed protein product [Allacma fusca]|uniref:Cyclin-Q n=1 Tax=Allacma fusca TaxID=39272 RepID=A0A8J2K9U7_9HEXA|nr:unnamed protein product [Allacma fusca]